MFVIYFRYFSLQILAQKYPINKKHILFTYKKQNKLFTINMRKLKWAQFLFWLEQLSNHIVIYLASLFAKLNFWIGLPFLHVTKQRMDNFSVFFFKRSKTFIISKDLRNKINHIYCNNARQNNILK